MISTRKLEAELLDELPADAPAAVHSRRDLRRINGLMGNARWLAAVARELEVPPPKTLVELASGDGVLLLRLLERMNWRPEHLILLDQQPVVTEETLKRLRRFSPQVEVVTADVFAWLDSAAAPRADLITTNLFLHHFADERLRMMFQLIAAKAEAFIACEPERSSFALFNTRLLAFIGCNHVTRHDAAISVRAGFQGQELARLWPADSGWEVTEKRQGLFSHCLGGRRQADGGREA